MKTKLFAALVAAVTLGAALPAAAQDWGRGHDRRGADIIVRHHGQTIRVDRHDRLFYRLVDSPYRFQPGLTYSYTDRCNRFGCVVMVSGRRGPVDRIFAPHLRLRGYDWRETRGFDHDYRSYGRYEDRGGWNRDDDYRGDRDRGDRDYRDRRDDRDLDGGRYPN